MREKALVDVVDVEYDGRAERAAGARASSRRSPSAELVVVCPSNPVTSVGPILAVPGIVDALARHAAPVVGVSPIVGGAAVSGPAGRPHARARPARSPRSASPPPTRRGSRRC